MIKLVKILPKTMKKKNILRRLYQKMNLVKKQTVFMIEKKNRPSLNKKQKNPN